MRINHNLMAMNTQRQMGINQSKSSKSIEKLSSGLRINRAGDDAAGLAISEKMRAQIRGLDQSSRNAQDGISMIQTAEGALNETQAILQRMRELAVQSSNDTNTTGDRDKIQSEIEQLNKEIDRIGNDTEFNQKKLLDGSLSKATTKAVHKAQNTGGFTAANAQLSAIQDADANSVALDVGDVITAHWTRDGVQYTATHTVAATDTLDKITTAMEGVAGGGISGVAATATGLNVVGSVTGATGSIGALTITAKSSIGVEKTAFNNAMNQFNVTQKAADASQNTTATIHIGANAGQSTAVDVGKVDSTSLGTNAVEVSTQAGADISITVIEDAITKVSEERSKIGAFQNRLEHTIANLNTSSENLQASESRIRDVDMAKEMMQTKKLDILNQAAQAMLAQANQAPQGVLQLLR